MKSQHFFWVKKKCFFSPKMFTPGSGPREPVPLARRRWIPSWQNRPDPRFRRTDGGTLGISEQNGDMSWGCMAICHGDVWLGCFIGRYHEQCSRSWFLSFTRKERISLWRWWTKWWAMPSPCRAPRLPAVHHQTLEKSWVFHNLGMGDFTPPFCWWFTPVVGLKDGRQFQHINKKNQQNRQNTSY